MQQTTMPFVHPIRQHLPELIALKNESIIRKKPDENVEPYGAVCNSEQGQNLEQSGSSISHVGVPLVNPSDISGTTAGAVPMAVNTAKESNVVIMIDGVGNLQNPTNAVHTMQTLVAEIPAASVQVPPQPNPLLPRQQLASWPGSTSNVNVVMGQSMPVNEPANTMALIPSNRSHDATQPLPLQFVQPSHSFSPEMSRFPNANLNQSTSPGSVFSGSGSENSQDAKSDVLADILNISPIAGATESSPNNDDVFLSILGDSSQESKERSPENISPGRSNASGMKVQHDTSRDPLLSQLGTIPKINEPKANSPGAALRSEAYLDPASTSTPLPQQPLPQDLISLLTKQLSKSQVEDILPPVLAMTPKGTGEGYGVGLDLDQILTEMFMESNMYKEGERLVP
jgi:hypothetical protein